MLGIASPIIVPRWNRSTFNVTASSWAMTHFFNLPHNSSFCWWTLYCWTSCNWVVLNRNNSFGSFGFGLYNLFPHPQWPCPQAITELVYSTLPKLTLHVEGPPNPQVLQFESHLVPFSYGALVWLQGMVVAIVADWSQKWFKGWKVVARLQHRDGEDRMQAALLRRAK